MASVKEHYDGMLGPVYSWILGNFEAAHEINDALFNRLQITAANGELAVDLGSGPGCQSVPLAERGFEVLAIDFCEGLLEELRGRAADLPVRTLCDDILNFGNHLGKPPQLIVCMGDTLCHLPNMDAVHTLINEVSLQLAPGGQFIATFRDYVSAEPLGAERFIPVRSSDEQIFTCFVEFKDEVVNVHDLLYRKVAGEWTLEVSEYNKIKIDPREVLELLQRLGMVAQQFEDNGMIVIQAEKTA